MELQARSDGVWGRVEWTPGGRKALQDKEYRFLSPVFNHRIGDGTVTQILSAGLVNNPNLSGLAPVVNSVQAQSDEEEPATIERLIRKGRDEGTPDINSIMASFGLSAPETTK